MERAAAGLASAIIGWQTMRRQERVLTTGFLDGSHPLVDAYELSVRLEHMLRRLAALAGAATGEAPVQVIPQLFLGGAMAADSHHLLAHMGITHIINATEVRLGITHNTTTSHWLDLSVWQRAVTHLSVFRLPQTLITIPVQPGAADAADVCWLCGAPRAASRHRHRRHRVSVSKGVCSAKGAYMPT